MTAAELLVLLAFASLAVELSVFPVPAETSCYQLVRNTGEPAAQVDDALARARRRSLSDKLFRYLLPTVVGIGCFLAPLATIIWEGLYAYLLPIPALETAAVRWLGALLIVVGRSITFFATLQLRRAPDQGLQLGGLFAVSRNPGLVGMFAFYLGLCCLYPGGVLFAGGVAYALNMHRRVLLEESALGRSGREDYRRYLERVPRYLLFCPIMAPNSNHNTQQRITTWFDNVYATRGLDYLRPPEAYPIFLQLLGAHEGETLLDVACGPGYLLRAALSQRLRPTGIDIASRALALASEQARGAPVMVGNAESLPFADGVFDHVVCLGAIERFLDRDRALREMRRVGRDEARFCFMVRNAATIGWRIWHQWLGRRNRRGHQDAATLEDWQALFQAQGFVIEAVHPDQWLHQRVRRLISGPRHHDRYEHEPVRRPILPLRFANEFIFILRK